MPIASGLLNQAAQAAHLPPVLARVFPALVQQESGGNPNAVSPAGAIGLTQLMPATAQGLGVDPHNPLQNLIGGARYLAEQYQRFGSVPLALAAYNAGPNAVARYGGVPPYAETQNYVKAILANAGAGAPPVTATAPAPTVVAPPPPVSQPQPTAGLPPQTLGLINANNRILGLPPLPAELAAPSAAAVPASVPRPLAAAAPAPLPSLTVQIPKRAQVSPIAGNVINLAKRYLGTPYQWGGANPQTGFDCSGFVQWLYAQKGVQLPRTTYDQWKAGVPVSKAQLMPGDIVFFEPTASGPAHEGLFIGHGQFIESPHTGATIRIATLATRRDYVGARRPTT